MAKTKQNPTQPNERDIAADLLLKEADDALRQDKMNAMWDEWGSTIIGVALMIILGTIIGVGWQKWQTARQIANTTSLIEFQNNPNSTSELSGSYQGIANMLSVIGMASEEEKNSTEITRLMEEAANTNLPKEWKILAEWGSLRSRADATVTGDIEEVRAINTALAEDMVQLANRSNNPYKPAILMEAGILYGENGQPQMAVTLLNQAKEAVNQSRMIDLEARINSYIQLYTNTEAAE